MRRAIKREKLLKVNGNYRYQFNWIGGGWNDVWAKDIKDFRREIQKQFGNCLLNVDYNSLHKATESSSNAWDKAGHLATC